MSKEYFNEQSLKEAKEYVEKVQNEELCYLLKKNGLLKKPQLKMDRISSNEIPEFNDIDPKRTSNKEYFMKMAELYNQLMFNYEKLEQSPSPHNRKGS